MFTAGLHSPWPRLLLQLTLVPLQGHLQPAGTDKPPPPQLMLALNVCLLKQEVGADNRNTGSWSVKGYCLHTADFTLCTH